MASHLQTARARFRKAVAVLAGAAPFVTFRGFAEGFFGRPHLRLVNVLRVEGLAGDQADETPAPSP